MFVVTPKVVLERDMGRDILLDRTGILEGDIVVFLASSNATSCDSGSLFGVPMMGERGVTLRTPGRRGDLEFLSFAF